jgi:uncharacterized protein
MISEKPYYDRETPPWAQFLIFVGVTLLLLLAGTGLALAYIAGRYGFGAMQEVLQMDTRSPLVIKALWVLQIVGTTLPIMLTPVVVGKWIMKQPQEYLRLNIKFPPILLLMVFSIMVLSTPIMEVLVTLNQRMVLPQWLKGLEEWMRSSERSAQDATMALLKMNNWWDCVKTVLLVGLATAFAEELMFRGCLQTIFLKWTRNTHMSIWITAALFSAFHMQFFGFLPRLALGVFFGYFTAWSGSIWPAVWAHFINNGTAVIMTYLFQKKLIHVDPNDPHEFSYSLYILSIIITVALLWSYRNAGLRKNDHHRY